MLEGALSLIPETFVVTSPQSAKASQHMFSRVHLSSSVLEPMPLRDGIPSIVWALFGMTWCTSGGQWYDRRWTVRVPPLLRHGHPGL